MWTPPVGNDAERVGAVDGSQRHTRRASAPAIHSASSASGASGARSSGSPKSTAPTGSRYACSRAACGTMGNRRASSPSPKAGSQPSGPT